MNKIQEAIIWKPLAKEDCEYEKSWYCNENKVIHKKEKEYLNCKHCITEEDKNEYEKLQIERFLSWHYLKELDRDILLRSYNIKLNLIKPWL